MFRNDTTAAGKEQFWYCFQKCQLDLQEIWHEPGEFIIINISLGDLHHPIPFIPP